MNSEIDCWCETVRTIHSPLTMSLLPLQTHPLGSKPTNRVGFSVFFVIKEIKTQGGYKSPLPTLPNAQQN